MLKMVFSLPVHEKAEVILDEVLNILYFNPDSAIILHLSPVFSQNTGWFTEKQFYKIISEMDNVYINPERIETGWRGTGVSGLVKVHISNFYYALTAIDDFEYFILEASNDLYIKRGLYEYISKYDYGQGDNGQTLVRETTHWVQGKRALQDKRLRLMMTDFGISDISGAQIEGTFFKKALFQDVAKVIMNYSHVPEAIQYAYEEIYFSTISRGLYKNSAYLKCIDCLVKVFWDNKQFLPTVDDIEECFARKNIFAVKRIPRNYYFNTREYIRDNNNQYDFIEKGFCEKILYVLNEEIWQEPYKQICDLLRDGKYNEAIYSLLQLNDHQMDHSLASVVLLFNYIRLMNIKEEYSLKKRILVECVCNVLLTVAVSEDTILSAITAADAIKYCVNNDICISPKYMERVNTLLLQAVNKLEDDGDILGACYLLSVIKLVTSIESEIYHLASEIMHQQIGIS